MKQSFQLLTATIKNFSTGIILCLQLSIVLLSLPLLYVVGISYNAPVNKKANQFIIMTNKGKKIIVTTYTQRNDDVSHSLKFYNQTV